MSAEAASKNADDRLRGKAADSSHQISLHISELLGLDEPVSEAVVHGVVEDPLYLHHLLTCRDAPEFLGMLLENPPAPIPDPSTASSNLSTATLTGSAVNAFWQWAKTGFTFVDAGVYQARLSVCRSCPNYVDPPKLLLYTILGSTDTEHNKICQLCGCVISKKAMLPSESCPDMDPNNPRFNRWGEQID